MGSQTLEILRQGVWASLTGGWFYDPHQGVFCNVVHLYLWLFLLCSPFVAYLYFPGTWISWFLYCIGTSLTILGVKLVNMALHRLYDRAQTMSDTNLKNQFFKVTKETEPREDEAGIEMKVMRNDGSVEQAINEASEENSMMSIENVNSIIDLKVDVHRKNSSESIELMFYAPSVMSSNSQQDQQSIFGSASVTKSIRSSSAVPNCVISGEANTKYLTVYPEDDNENSPRPSTSKAASASIASNAALPNNSTLRQINLLRKSSEDHKRRRQRRRPERQSSLDASADSTIVPKLVRNQSDTIATAPGSIMRTATFLYPQNNTQDDTSAVRNRNKSNTTESNALHKTSSTITSTSNIQRLSTTTTSLSGIATPSVTTSTSAVVVNPRSSRLHRHRSSETHDERIKCNRNLFLPIHHVSSAAIGGGISDIDELELSLGGSAQGVDGRGRTLKSWILGSSSDVYIEDDSYTKSDLGIEQIDGRSSNASGRAVLLLQQQQQQLNSHYPHQHQYRAHHHSTNIRKDSNNTDDGERSGRVIVVVTPEYIKKVQKLVISDRKLKLEQCC
ncbi:protein pecanex-like [Teleopsis dalmanni]|uniref:protein pecanex-like n=1 Tax=Teleopsis dalmanni TaxID=139649 RepID=UPI0018CD6170|nr:protein pecanex-like [Teleopsis dalmanni]